MGNCKTVCREIEESEAGSHLSEVAEGHLRSCLNCHEFNDSRLKLRQMVAGLVAVKAPADFDFRLRARLANEGKQPAPFLIRKQAFGFPSLVLATLALLVGAGLAARVLWPSAGTSSIVRSETPSVNQPVPPFKEKPPAEKQAVVKVADRIPDQTSARNKPTVAKPGSFAVKGTGRTAVAMTRGKDPVATKDFSSGQAPVVKRNDSIVGNETAGIFPIEASEPMKISLDYATGISRTISLPPLSFGSQQVVSPGVSQMVKTSVKGVW